MNVLIYGVTGKKVGGIESFVLNMNEHMSKDCVFDYILDGEECDYRERVEKRGGRILFVPWVRLRPFGFIHTLWIVFGEEKRRGTKVFYQQLFSMTKLIPAILAKLRGYKVILHAHNSGLQKSGRLYRINNSFGKLIARSFHFTYFTNSHNSSVFMFGKGVKSELIYNAIDIDKFNFDFETRNNVRKETGSESKIVVGFVGRLSWEKNPVFMVHVFNEIKKINPKCELWIVGEGDMRRSIEKEAESFGINNDIKWWGHRNDVNKLMMGMDLLLQPSLFEGLGIVLVEAQATGLPVISSQTVISEEAVVSNRIKLLPLEKSPAYWADESIRFLSDSAHLGNRDDCNVPEFYNIEYEARRLENLLSDIANSN